MSKTYLELRVSNVVLFALATGSAFVIFKVCIITCGVYPIQLSSVSSKDDESQLVPLRKLCFFDKELSLNLLPSPSLHL